MKLLAYLYYNLVIFSQIVDFIGFCEYNYSEEKKIGDGDISVKRTIRPVALLISVIFIFSASVISTCAAEKTVLRGDADLDGEVSSADARIIMRISVGMDCSDERLPEYLDLNRDGVITAADARAALRISVGLSVNETVPSDAEPVGISEKGYTIYRLDGITYVDSIMLANKTYALPSDYNPGGLTEECSSAFTKMQSDAAAQGLTLYINSAFRSYDYQKNLYNRYVSRDGKRLADTYSARPGHSEHQTGLSLDLNTVTQSFAETAEGKWVAAHCHEYGFIIRYPKGKTQFTGYCYEPWHLRYVGIEKATAITNSGMCLEEYYGITSVYA